MLVTHKNGCGHSFDVQPGQVDTVSTDKGNLFFVKCDNPHCRATFSIQVTDAAFVEEVTRVNQRR